MHYLSCTNRNIAETWIVTASMQTNFAKVGVEGSNPFARSNFCHD
jgi:hypothetical protein